MSKDFVKFVLEGTIAHPNYEDFVEDKRKKNKKLAGADEVKFAGAPHHTSDQDPKMRASGQVFRGTTSRLTSVHVYEDGTVVYSKESVNDAQED
ncbi:conserved hypothetical protein [Histoplasma capsulatum var. duboisii H88]|uniref:Uncharacterized protein n=2 Tax=Ajellomyces capsulatus TaxID=5037 RepID=F0U803_AJEC8|nr:conserved hypothetical protein [Histoplasma capsulatum H143]EGC40825.1 conserved hypothetical protein [Histoplasma capsulatum var. duboisii H88]